MNSKLVCRILLLLGVLLPGAQAQLAITEVMSLASWEPTASGVSSNNRPDYWELTNFGTNTINLHGYGFSDKRRTDKIEHSPFNYLSITGGQTIVFFRVDPGSTQQSSITNAARFRQWWGEGKIPANTLFRAYDSPGLNGTYGDELWVYDNTTNNNVVDGVFMGQAWLGKSFVSERDSGHFGALSVAGKDNAVVADIGGDIGSPGTAIGPFPLMIQEFPQTQTADAGSDVTFTVRATGLPRPKYQWRFNGQNLTDNINITGVNSNTLTILNVGSWAAGNYSVVVYNGLESWTTPDANLTVQTTPGPPVLMQLPVDLTVFPGQSAVFSARARGYPACSYQWQFNGVDIDGAQGPTLTLSNVTNDMSGLYTLLIQNPNGWTNASAVLHVVPRPKLRITEVMGIPYGGDSSRHYNWFELTNGDTNTVDLMGYRFADSLSFEGAWRINTPLSIRSGESIVFVESMDPTRFWYWWGPENNYGIQIYSWGGFSLGMVEGTIYIWNGGATDRSDWTSAAEWAYSDPDIQGISVECMDNPDPDALGVYMSCGWAGLMDSQLGFNGAYYATTGRDLGSPGFTTNPPPRIVSITNSGNGIELKCRVTPNMSYALKSSAVLTNTSWPNQGSYISTSTLLFINDPGAATNKARYYKLEELR